MADHGVVCSMSRSGNVWDNAAMESFFSSLKTERTARKMYRTRDAAKADVFDYIERFYNPKRRHSTIGYISPMEYAKCSTQPPKALKPARRHRRHDIVDLGQRYEQRDADEEPERVFQFLDHRHHSIALTSIRSIASTLWCKGRRGPSAL